MTAPHPLVAILAAERERRRISRGALARRLGYKPQTLHAWETGIRTPGLDRIADLAAALGYDLALIPRQTEPARMPPITPERARRNRAVLAGALGIENDLGWKDNE